MSQTTQPIPRDLDPDTQFALEVQHEGEPRLITTSMRALATALAPFLGQGGGTVPPPPPPPPATVPVDVVPVLMTTDDVAKLIVPQVVEALMERLKLKLALKPGAKPMATTSYVLRDVVVQVQP